MARICYITDIVNVCATLLVFGLNICIFVDCHNYQAVLADSQLGFTSVFTMCCSFTAFYLALLHPAQRKHEYVAYCMDKRNNEREIQQLQQLQPSSSSSITISGSEYSNLADAPLYPRDEQ